MKQQKQWTQQEKQQYAEDVRRWKSKLVRYRDFNVYYHPDKPTLPYRKTFQNGYPKMVRWNVSEDGVFRVKKDNEQYTLNAFELQTTNTLADFLSNEDLSPKPETKDGWVNVMVPEYLKPIVEKFVAKELMENKNESPF